MAKKRKSTLSTRFLQRKSQPFSQEVFADGAWTLIKEDLALSGWGALQRETIHDCLKRGLPLSYAVKKVADHLGSCPIKSKPFF